MGPPPAHSLGVGFLNPMPSVWDCFEPTVWRLEWGKKISERRFQFLCAPTVEKREKITLCKILNKLFIRLLMFKSVIFMPSIFSLYPKSVVFLIIFTDNNNFQYI